MNQTTNKSTAESGKPDAMLRSLSKAIIVRAIRDMCKADGAVFSAAKNYIYSDDLPKHIASAGFPNELLDTLKNAVLLSKAQRVAVAREAIQILLDAWSN